MEQRLIDANKIKYRTVGAGGWNQPENVVSDYEIDKMPTVDAVEVVRCWECKFWDMCSIREAMAVFDCNAYCYRGERKLND